jgi:hypothetical protein
MFSRSDDKRAVRGSVAKRSSAALIVAAIAAPMVATSGVMPREVKEGSVAPLQAEAPKPAMYQVRCWQFGHLVFEENDVVFNIDGGRYSPKLRGTDRKGVPLYIADTKNATCLIRSATPETQWPQ